MKIIRLTLSFILLGTSLALAQTEPRVTSGIDLGVGYGDAIWVPAVTYHQELSLANFSWFRIGWGVRTWGHYEGPTNLMPKDNSVSNDYLKFGKITSNGISMLAGANVKLGRLEIGGNTDLFGIAFGVKRKALYTKNYKFEGDDAGYYNKLVKSGPNFINALPLALDNQNGMSEVYLRYWFARTVAVKVAYVVGRTTYRAAEKLDNDQNLFSKMYKVPSVSLTFPLYN